MRLPNIARFLLLPALVLSAPLSLAAPAAKTAQPPVPLLWKVSDADNSVYLLGSFHLLKPGDYPLSKDVDAAFADAESVLFEIRPEEMESPALQMQMAQAGLRGDGSRLDGELKPATVAMLQAWVQGNASALQKLALSPQTMQMLEPWFAGLVISVVEMTKQGLDPALGLDNHIAGLAAKASKPTGGLETGAEQIAFLDGMAKEEQLQFLSEALSEAGEASTETAKMHDAWRRGDAATLWNDMAVDMKREYPRLYQRINVARNDAWVPKIEKRLADPGKDDTLVVVGALHLLGKDGVVEKLRAKGYRVVRICSACNRSGAHW